MSGGPLPSTLDTNIAIYALHSGQKTERAVEVLRRCDFLSIQVFNEYANVARRKHGRTWAQVAEDIADLRKAVRTTRPVDIIASLDALRLADRYHLSFYDSVMLAVALAGGARTLYSEDMQDGLVIDGTLRIVDPFR